MQLDTLPTALRSPATKLINQALYVLYSLHHLTIYINLRNWTSFTSAICVKAGCFSVLDSQNNNNNKPCKDNCATTWQNQQSDCTPSEDSDQPGHPPSLISIFAVRSMGSFRPKLPSCGQRRLWFDCANAQADLSLRWAQTHFVGLVLSCRGSCKDN